MIKLLQVNSILVNDQKIKTRQDLD